MICEFCKSRPNDVLYGYPYDDNRGLDLKICGCCCKYLESKDIKFPMYQHIERLRADEVKTLEDEKAETKHE